MIEPDSHNDVQRGDAEPGEVSPDAYRHARPLSGVERLLWVIDHVARANMMFDLKVSGAPPSIDHIERAYEVMRSQCPLLRSRLRGRSRPVVVAEEELFGDERRVEMRVEMRAEMTQGERADWGEAHLALPIFIRERASTPADLDSAMSARLDLHRGPPIHLHVFRPPSLGRWRALFVVHHMATDAMSCLRAIQVFLNALNPSSVSPLRVEWSVARTLPSRELIPQAARSPRAITRSLLRRAREHIKWMLLTYPLTLPRSSDLQERSTRPAIGSNRYHLPASQVDRLRRLARESEVSLHALMCAAQLLALREMLSGKSERSLSIYSPTNLRPRLSYPDGLGGAQMSLEGGAVSADHMGQLVGYAQSSVSVSRDLTPVGLCSVAQEISRQLRLLLDASDDVTVHHISDRIADWIDREPWWRRVARSVQSAQRGERDQRDQCDRDHDVALHKRARRLAWILRRSVFHSTTLSSVGEAGLSLDPQVGALDEVGVFSCPGAMNAWMSVATLQEGALYWAFSWSRGLISDEVAGQLSARSVYHLTRLIGAHDE